MVTLERTVLFAPFGVLFWDPATQTPVHTGLEVVHRRDAQSAAVRAVPNRSGVYLLRGLPGLGDVERGAGAGPVPTGRYRVEVTDPQGQFLPVAFDADLPTPIRGLFDPGCDFRGSHLWEVPSPPGSPVAPALPVVPLFSAPGRPLPPGMAVLRAQLRTVGGEAAAWAVLETSVGDRATGLGVADGNGLATVVFPYPEPTALLLSPPGYGSSRLSDQSWALDVHAYFGGGSPPSAAPVADPSGIPDLCDLLDQHPVTLLADESGTPLSSVDLRYGRELVLRTSPHSILLFVPAGSPPQP
jgi:hypothetical protein